MDYLVDSVNDTLTQELDISKNKIFMNEMTKIQKNWSSAQTLLETERQSVLDEMNSHTKTVTARCELQGKDHLELKMVVEKAAETEREHHITCVERQDTKEKTTKEKEELLNGLDEKVKIVETNQTIILETQGNIKKLVDKILEKDAKKKIESDQVEEK